MLKVAFINPPIRSNALAHPLTWMLMRSYYQRFGAHKDSVEWIAPPYKWDKYKTIEDIYEEIKDADIFLFSSYIWNYDICDSVAAYAKSINPLAVCIVGGPHIGTNDKEFLDKRTMYDFFCKATKPGEIFITEFLDAYISNGEVDYNDLSWELRSSKVCQQHMANYSVYEDSIEYLKEIGSYADQNNFYKDLPFESTRGCPFSCVYCEWGGGTSSKVIKKEIDIVERDILAIKEAGFVNVMCTDANFGMYRERDLYIFEFAASNGVHFKDLNLVKLTKYEKRAELSRGMANITEKYPNLSDIKNNDVYLLQTAIQTISPKAIKVAKRVDMSIEDKLKISEYTAKLTNSSATDVELILGMPGSTLDDFYAEYELHWKGKSNSIRYIYMVLPDAEVSSPEYLLKHKINLVDVLHRYNNPEGSVNLYADRYVAHKTISSCFSYTQEEMQQMWVMNYLGIELLPVLYPAYEKVISAPEFMRVCWEAIKTLEEYEELWGQAKNLFDQNTPAMPVEYMCNEYYLGYAQRFIIKNKDALNSYLYNLLHIAA